VYLFVVAGKEAPVFQGDQSTTKEAYLVAINNRLYWWTSQHT